MYIFPMKLLGACEVMHEVSLQIAAKGVASRSTIAVSTPGA